MVIGVLVAGVVFLLVLGLAGGDEEGGDDAATEAARTERTETQARRTTPAPKPRPAPRGVRVRIAPDGPTYVCLDSGEGTERVFEGTLEEPRTFRNAKELRLNLGRRSVTITANGKRVTFEPSGEPLGLRVTRTSAREITEGPRPCA